MASIPTNRVRITSKITEPQLLQLSSRIVAGKMGACDLPAEIRTKPSFRGFAFIALLSGQACRFAPAQANNFFGCMPTPAVSADSVLLGDINQGYSRIRQQWSSRSLEEENKSQQPAKHCPDNSMKTEQEQPEQVEPDGINSNQQSPDNV